MTVCGVQLCEAHPGLLKAPAKICEAAVNAESTMMAVGTSDGAMWVVTCGDMRLVGSTHEHTRFVSSLRWCGGKLASGSDDGTIRVYVCCAAPADIQLQCVLSGHAAGVPCISWSPHCAHVLASASYDGTAQVY